MGTLKFYKCADVISKLEFFLMRFMFIIRIVLSIGVACLLEIEFFMHFTYFYGFYRKKSAKSVVLKQHHLFSVCKFYWHWNLPFRSTRNLIQTKLGLKKMTRWWLWWFRKKRIFFVNIFIQKQFNWHHEHTVITWYYDSLHPLLRLKNV